MLRVQDISWRMLRGIFNIGGTQALLFFSIALTCSLTIAAVAHYDRVAFVAPCMWNGNSFTDCSCTHAALPNLPELYKPVAQSWAHGSRRDRVVALAGFFSGEAKRTVLNQLSLSDQHKVGSDAAKIGARWWKRSARLSTKWVNPGLAMTMTIAKMLNDFTSNFSDARKAYSTTCGGTANKLFAAYVDLKADIAHRVDSVGTDSVRIAVAAASKLKTWRAKFHQYDQR
jgi:hypothetical protein